MTKQIEAITARCRELGIDDAGLTSIRNFIAAAFYHVRLEGTPPADKHLAYDNAIRRATNRIACQGGYGSSQGLSRLLSRKAIELREQIANDASLRTTSEKYRRWLDQVTEEHQDPVVAVEAWITKNLETTTVDDVVLRLLTHPSVIITREEERRIPKNFRWEGAPADRYREAGIERLPVDQGTFEFFGGRRRKITKYSVATRV